MKSVADEVHAYRKIQRVIQDRIQKGALNPGDTVPSERELARTHGVSLMTARHALAGLEREGIVERRRGAGTFVAPPKIQFNKLASFTEQMTSRGLSSVSRVLQSSLVDGEPDVAARLGLPSESRLIRLDRLRLAAGEPLAVETCYLAGDEFMGLLGASMDRRSLFNILENEYAVRLSYADEEVDATSAEAKTAKLLDVPRGTPLLRMRQVIYSTSGRPVIYVLGLYRSDRQTLLTRRYR
jgi:GntR family transcriptional regulator